MDKITLSDVSYVYSKDTPFETSALNHVSVSFEKGRVTGVIGHTGSGKSTLVGMLNGLIRPTEGKVLIDGKDIWEKPKEIRNIRFRVGLVMQYPEYQLFDETVEKDIGFGPRNMGLSEDEVRLRVREAMDFVRLPTSLLSRSPFELSGGQKRRCAIAGVVAMRPEVLVLDEPAAGLDPRGKEEILGGLKEYLSFGDKTVILVSHSMEDMARHCDNIVVMNRGEVLKSGSVSEVFSYSEELQRVGLDIPEVSRIALALKARGYRLDGELYTVSGVKNALLSLLGKGGER